MPAGGSTWITSAPKSAKSLPQQGPPTPLAGQPRSKRIAVLDLSDKSDGNAVGSGFIDVASTRLARKINLHDLYINTISNGDLDQARLPILLPSDREAIRVAMRGCGETEGSAVRLVWARNAARTDEFFVSEALVPELAGLPNVERLGERERFAEGVSET